MTPATLIRTAFRRLKNNQGMPGPAQREPWFHDTTYGLGVENGTRVRGGPDWSKSEKYTIAATVANGPVDAATLAGPMLLALLEEKFKLKLHVESEDIDVWDLGIAKGGLKMKPMEPGTCYKVPPPTRPPDKETEREITAARGTKPVCENSILNNSANWKIAIGGNMSQLAEFLSLASFVVSSVSPGDLSTLDGRLVVDKTGLPDTTMFDIALEFGTDSGPTLSDALAKLGLKLDRGKSSREYVVIDRIERPSEN
jgi:uncharacterized protein (TIGR03435 family)